MLGEGAKQTAIVRDVDTGRMACFIPAASAVAATSDRVVARWSNFVCCYVLTQAVPPGGAR